MPPAPLPQRMAYLSVSDFAPERGGTIIVAGTVTVGDSMSLGSYRVRLGYDPRRLAYLGEVRLPELMRVVNPQSGEVIVVGASSENFADGRLFELRFEVIDPSGLESLSLVVDELNDATFKSQMLAVRKSSTLTLDRGLARAKGVP